MSSDRLLSVAEARDRLAVCNSTLYQLLRSGQLASLKIGKSRRIPESALEAFIAERMQSTGTAA